MIIKPTPGGSELPELYDVITPKGWTGDKIKLKIAVKMDKPVNLKKCGLVLEHLFLFFNKSQPVIRRS